MVTTLHCRILTLQRLLPKPKQTILSILWSGSPLKALVISIVEDKYNQSAVGTVLEKYILRGTPFSKANKQN